MKSIADLLKHRDFKDKDRERLQILGELDKGYPDKDQAIIIKIRVQKSNTLCLILSNRYIIKKEQIYKPKRRFDISYFMNDVLGLFS